MQLSRLLLVDDHTLFRESLGRLLASESDLEIVGQCGRGVEALALLAPNPPDLVLLDFHLPDGDGAKFIQAARHAGYAGKILIVTGGIDAQASTEVLRLGISGVFLKHNPVESLLRAIRIALAGDVWLDPKIIEFLAMHTPRPAAPGLADALSPRERQVMQALLDGFTNKGIADRLGITEGAVKATLQTLFDKANVRTRSQLVRVALEGADEM
jgi:two-component system nitrate/nitrite response regulator NarL